ncbi:helix-turn-helix domain-containing protein [Actinokineospora sp. 24-640]
MTSAAEVARAVGQEIRRARSALGWTRADLVERMDSDMHVQTIASYEQGTRHCTVARLVEISRALGTVAPELFAFALQRAEIDLDRTGVRVDLHAITGDHRAELAPCGSGPDTGWNTTSTSPASLGLSRRWSRTWRTSADCPAPRCSPSWSASHPS